MESLETRIEHIESKAIRELTAQYCHAVVDGDAEKIVSLFSEDGTFRAHNLAPQGSKALLEFYTAGISQKAHEPFIQNHVIELLGKSKAKDGVLLKYGSIKARLIHNQAITLTHI